MKRLTCLFAVLFGIAAISTAHVSADSDSRSVTGAAKGRFAASASLGVITLNGLELGTGVFIEADGSASGTFHATLQGTVLGVARQVTVEGKASEGSIAPDGRATFSGTASIDLGDGTLPLLSVPLRVTAGANGVELMIDGVALPAATLTAGAVTVD
jgi:hypothetical protein